MNKKQIKSELTEAMATAARVYLSSTRGAVALGSDARVHVVGNVVQIHAVAGYFEITVRENVS